MKHLRFKIRTLLLVTFAVALLFALGRDVPFVEHDHGSFVLPVDAEISVYEFFDDPHFGNKAAPGNWNVTCRWVNRGNNHWTPISLQVVAENANLEELTWSEPELAGVSGSIASVIDARHVREHGAYPIDVPWSDKPLTKDSASLGEYDEFWNMKFALLIVDYGVILSAGNGDDGAFNYTLGRDSKGLVCAVKCRLEDDPEFWLQNYYSHPQLKRMWWNLLHRLGG